jgi:hypothetical protein
MIAIAVGGYLSLAWYRSYRLNSAFDQVSIGNADMDALAILGDPSVREVPSKPFLRYATQPCQSPCVERLWFENRLLLDIEAWSIELDGSHRVIRKTHWVSP